MPEINLIANHSFRLETVFSWFSSVTFSWFYSRPPDAPPVFFPCSSSPPCVPGSHFLDLSSTSTSLVILSRCVDLSTMYRSENSLVFISSLDLSLSSRLVYPAGYLRAPLGCLMHISDLTCSQGSFCSSFLDLLLLKFSPSEKTETSSF